MKRRLRRLRSRMSDWRRQFPDMWVEHGIGVLFSVAGAVVVIAVALAVALLPRPVWPLWSDLALADRLAVASVLITLFSLIGIVVGLGATALQLQRTFPSQRLLFEVVAEPVEEGLWYLVVQNGAAFVSELRVEVDVTAHSTGTGFGGRLTLHPPAGNGWVQADVDWSMDAATHQLELQHHGLFPGQRIIGPWVSATDAAARVTWAITWWTDRVGPETRSVSHPAVAADFPDSYWAF